MSNVDPETGIWSLNILHKHKTDFMLAAAIGMYYDPPRRTIDLGCGPGHYCRILNVYGWENIDGYEGTKGMVLGKHKVWPWIYCIDLSKPVEFIPYDFVLCLEVGEHIPQKHEQVFIDNIVKATGRDLVMSWAVPGQGGTGHINCRDNKYIVEQMWNRGLRYDKKMTRRLRYYAMMKYFKNTVMVFRKE